MGLPQSLLKAIGRDQGPQLWFSSPFTPATAGNVTVQSPSFADLSRPASHVKIVLRYRATVGTAAYASLNAEAPQNLLQNVYLFGKRARTNSTTIYNGSGATLFGLNSAFKNNGVAARQFITFPSGSPVRMPRLSSPMGLAVGTASGNFGGIGAWDVQSEYVIPFGPFGGGPKQDLLFSQRDADWNRTMQMILQIGGNTSAATDNFGVKGASGTLAFTGFGASGSPMVYVYLIPTLQDGNTADTKIINSYRSGVIQRATQAPSASLATTSTNALLALLQNYDTPKIITKSGVTNSLGDYVSLSDSILTKQYLTIGGKPITQFNDEWSQQGWYEEKSEGQMPQGYNEIDFVGGGVKLHWGRILRAPSAAQQMNLSSDITGASNQAGEILQEQVLEEPVIA